MFVSFEIDENLLEKITFRKSFIREYLKKMWKKGSQQQIKTYKNLTKGKKS